MRTVCLYRPVFNRSNSKLQPTETALIQIEILLPSRRKKYISTGIKVKKSQWNKKGFIENHALASSLNVSITDKINELRRIETAWIDKRGMVLPDDFTPKEDKGSFVAYIISSANKRKDITTATRSRHLLAAERLKGLHIISYEDLTLGNIKRYDNLLREDRKQTTIHGAHKIVKHYIHEAEREGLIPYGKNPYLQFEVKKGRSAIRTRLDDTEIEKLQSKELDGEMDLVRDICLFQIYTGVAYSDLLKLSSKNVRINKDESWIEGLRKKTGELYSVYLLPEALKIIDKYKNNQKLLPVLPIFTQNRRLKVLAASCGIDKKLTTHVLRHTAASLWLRRGVSLSAVQSMLGHSSIKTTEIYGKLERQDIKEQMSKLKKGAAEAPSKSP